MRNGTDGEARGVRVVRAPAADVLRDPDAVAEWILRQARRER